MKRTNRRKNGSVIAEFPATLYLIFVGLLVPMMGLGMIGYRISMIYFAVRDACYQAAKSPTFSLAQTNAATAWTKDKAAWTGIDPTSTEIIYIITQPLPTGTEKKTASKLPVSPPPDPAANAYFIRLIAQTSVEPFFYGKWEGLKVPGLTAPVPLQMTYQCYVENTAGLTQ
jgi:hypothetical protein